MSESLVKQEFLTELESILESDETYGSNVQILTYSVKKDVINGKFKDSWNKRVYEFVIDIDGISYKPAAKLDSFSVDELPVRFDAYSEGYGSLFENIRLDRNPIGKRVKKPKCGKEGYGCGFSCIGLAKTCRILSTGQKTKGNFQERAIGKERLRKLLELGDKILALGKKGALIRASDIKDQIERERSRKAGQLIEARKEKLAQRQPPVKEPQLTKVTKVTRKPQEKQPAKLKPESLPKNIQLSNKEFRVADDAEVRQKISQWTSAYKEIEKITNDEDIDEPPERIRTATTVVSLLLEMQTEKDVKFGGVVDKNGKLQAAYTYTDTESGYYVDYLASAPWNCLESHPDKKLGAGASAMEALIKDAIDKKKEGTLELVSLPNAIPFYKKIGFTAKNEKDEYPSMKLDAQNAKDFIDKQERKTKQDSISTKLAMNRLTGLELLEEQAFGLFAIPRSYVSSIKNKL
jgi:hypothetical protein